MCFSFVGGGGVQSVQGLMNWFMFPGESHMVHDAHLFILPVHMQAGLEPAAAGRNGANFSQRSVAWGGFPWARDLGQTFPAGSAMGHSC
jgi:hypothetical protein